LEPITVIRDAAWIVAWDEANQRHAYLRDEDVVFRGDTIVNVGRRYAEAVDVEVDGRERLVIPGLVNIHAHPSGEPLRKGITDEIRRGQACQSASGAFGVAAEWLYDYYRFVAPL